MKKADLSVGVLVGASFALLFLFLLSVLIFRAGGSEFEGFGGQFVSEYKVFMCLDGCYFSEGLLFNHSNMSEPSWLYSECADLCFNESCRINPDGLGC